VRARGLWCAALLWAAPAAAQTAGSLAGTVRDATTGAPVAGAVVELAGTPRSVSTDTSGFFRMREVRAGWHRLAARAIGYRAVVRESVLVRAGQSTVVGFELMPAAIELAPLTIAVPVDPVLDPLAISTTQRVTAQDLRQLPVTTIDEAIALSAGAVGESYRGGRLGQQAFILDGLGLKNQLDASSGPLGVRLPPDILTEAALVTNGFSARYGQALSGLINVVTKEGGERWHGRLAYESDRALWSSWDLGLDRFVAQADGPLPGGIRLLAALDATGRLDADPVNAPPPGDPRDPRSDRPNLLPHNSGEQVDLVGKLTIPLSARHTVRLFGLRSVDQRLLFDPAYKYDLFLAPARRVTGELYTGHWQYASGDRSAGPSLVADLRLAHFERQFLRGTLEAEAPYRFGGFTGRRFRFLGEQLAVDQDTLGASGAVPGFALPDFSVRTPWGVPAFFMGSGSRGEIAWNSFRELRAQLDLNIGAGRNAEFYLGGELVRQRVRTFQRVLAFLPAGDSVPPPTASDFRPRSGAAYAEVLLRLRDLAFTLGGRYDAFDPRTGEVAAARARRTLSPRLGISTVLRGATVVVSWGRFSQAPDFQYLVDAAFDDTTRTGRFRRGNPSLGFERASQYEFSVRARPAEGVSLRVNAYVKQLQGLVASVPLGVEAESTIFGNADFGNVQGIELVFDREMAGGWGVRLAYTLQEAEATATNAFQLFQRIRIAPGGVDTIIPARVEFPLDYDRRHGLTGVFQVRVDESAGPRLLGQPLVGRLEGAAIVRVSSGLPYSRTNATGDTLIGLPNSNRLPTQATVDVLLRRPLRLAGLSGSLYLDARNLLGRRNVVAVRRDTGEPGLGPEGVELAALQAYAAHPEAIPYESPRYRPFADLDADGLIEGEAELFPLFLAASRDFHQPLFAFGPPRVVRIGAEVIF
jgi:hypothetical protein